MICTGYHKHFAHCLLVGEAPQFHIRCHTADKMIALNAGLVDQELAGEIAQHPYQVARMFQE
jgi:hypothetical protein